MKRLDTFLEGLLNKSNKNKIITNIDVRDMDEMAKVFPKHQAYNDRTITLDAKENLCIVAGRHVSGKIYDPEIDVFVNINGKLYDFYLQLGGLDPKTQTYKPHRLESGVFSGSESVRFLNEGYFWIVDINDAKAFIENQFESYNKVETLAGFNTSKMFEKWLGVKLDVVG